MSVKKIIKKSASVSFNKPDTVTRAGITANLKFTRGKQLVEHDPLSLIPDPQNPRPGELIDDDWLKENLKVGTEAMLCRVNPKTGEFNIPDIEDLDISLNDNLVESFNFLKRLAYSIRNDGLIEPIEIFLADKENDPNYFVNSNLNYGYVVLEGHQRRLAAIMARVPTVTCIQLTDETTLAKLKVKHRKLRRQLSENNLRKGLTVSQNYQIVEQLLKEYDNTRITAKELSKIIGLNEDISGSLKKIILNCDEYPAVFISSIKNDKLTFQSIRKLAAKSFEDIEDYFKFDSNKKNIEAFIKEKQKPRGRQGGAIKKSAVFKIKDESESDLLGKFLLKRFPELGFEIEEKITFKTLEYLLKQIKNIATREKIRSGSDSM